MFYSHEVLTSRKYGVATIWLVATLGSKSALNKVSRKAILDVNVAKACETILTPEAPLALRLQSNLLIGVSRVFSQQCNYVLADAQNAQNNIRATFNVLKTAELDPEAGRARPDQLVLQDDPTFLPDFALAPLDFDLSNDISGSQFSAFSPRNPRRSLTLEDEAGVPVGGIIVPTSETSRAGDIGGFIVPGDDGPGARVLRGDDLNLEDDGFMPGADFGFDVEGNLVEYSSPKQPQRTPGAATGPALASESAASARVRREHEEAQGAGANLRGDLMDVDLGDGFDLLPEGPVLASIQDQQRPPSGHLLNEVDADENSSSVQAPMRRKRKARTIPLDTTMELRNADLSGWMNQYVENMAEAAEHKQQLRAASQAKKNAEYWVLGLGIGGVGAIVGNSGLPGPLDMFRGEALLRSLGIERTVVGRKRGQDEVTEEETDEEARRVRQRSEEDQLRPDMEDGGFTNIEDDVEMAREEQEGMESRLSQPFPWNITASVRDSSAARSSHAALGLPTSAGGPSSIGGIPGSLGRRGSRLISASPLHGRGRPGGLEPLRSIEPEDGGDDDNLGIRGGDVELGDEDFELYGAAAAVDTQTANESQFMRVEFAEQMIRFGEFVVDTLREKREAAANEGADVEGINEILFDELIRPESNSAIVGAQGFMHLLSLATQGRVAVRQDEPFAEIGISLPLASSI